MRLDVAFNPDGSSHGDITLRLGEYEWQCDSYYFALDRGLDGETGEAREDDTGARRVLVRLLEQWLQANRDVEDGAVAYLPFDYSDQCMGCVRLRKSGAMLSATLGWSSREGWTTCPSDISDFLFSVTDFRPIGAESLDLTSSELLESVKSSLAKLDRAP